MTDFNPATSPNRPFAHRIRMSSTHNSQLNVPQSTVTDASSEPDMLIMFRMLPRRVQHQFVQLAIDEMELDGPAEKSADAFLTHSAWEIEDGDDHLAGELYPQGCTHQQTWLRHRVKCAEALVFHERQASGRRAMLQPRAKLTGQTSPI